MKINDLICELLEEPVTQEDNGIEFTSRSVELIHEIAEMCNEIPIVQKTKEQAEDYAEGLSAEQVYMDMLVKIVEAPTAIHMKMSAKMLIPIISRKLKERGLCWIEKRQRSSLGTCSFQIGLEEWENIGRRKSA